MACEAIDNYEDVTIRKGSVRATGNFGVILQRTKSSKSFQCTYFSKKDYVGGFSA